MLRAHSNSFCAARRLLIVCIVIGLILSVNAIAQDKQQLMKHGAGYHATDDTSDRAADAYRQLIAQYPNSREAEAAQFSLGSYFSRKFFILEQRDRVQDWESFNKAEEALYKYVGTYPSGSYAADAYHTLAIIALRRGYNENAISAWNKAKEAAASDQKVYLQRIAWSPSDDDLIKRYCDSGALADFGLGAVARLQFHEAVDVLTKWARSNCEEVPSNATPEYMYRRKKTRP